MQRDAASGRAIRRGDLLALVPAAGLALVSFSFGTLGHTAGVFGVDLPGGATAAGAIGVQALVLAAALFAAPAWVQPLALGRRGRFLLPALWLTAAAAAWASPVSRAGLVAALTLPAWLLVPAAVARCWPGRRERRRGSAALAVVVGAVAADALWGRWLSAQPRAAQPLGHHELLAVWLLALLPVALLPVRAPGPARWLAGAGAALGGVALAATGSLAGGLGLAALLVVAGLRFALPRRGRRVGTARRLAAAALGLALVAATAALLPRLATVVAGRDPSARARLTYYAAGLRGLGERPLLGWGPGAVPWTVAEWLRPVPGLNPPSETLADLHSLPLQLGYEIGVPAVLFVAALAGLFGWRRLAARPVAADPELVTAGLLGLTGTGVALLFVAPLAVPAVPAALALVAGATLAGEGPRRLPGARRRGRGDLPVVLYVAAAALVLVPLDRAQLAYDRSLRADEAAAIALLQAAVDLDPAFPLYRAELAAARVAAGEAGEEEAERALSAAEDAAGVAPLWLLAGEAAQAAGEGWAPIAFERACHLDPLGAAAPFLLAVVSTDPEAAADAGGRALLAEPRLAAATYWEGRADRLDAAVAAAARWPGIEAGWRQALVDRLTGWDPAVAPGIARLTLTAADPSPGPAARWGWLPWASQVFRRSGVRAGWLEIDVRAGLARQVDLPPATVLPGSSPAAFGERGCRAGGE